MTNFRHIAEAATDELRRQICRKGPHEMVPAEMLKCPRCSAILLFEAAAREEAERAIVQTPEGSAKVARDGHD